MSQNLVGETCAVLTALTWAFALIFFKLSGERIAPLALNLFKNAVGLLLLLLTLGVLRVLDLDKGIATLADYPAKDVGILLISGFIGIALADTVFFYALNFIGVGIVAIVDCLYSPSVIFFAFVMLSESLGPFQYVGAALILAAVLVSTRLKPPVDRTRRQLVAGIVLGALSMALMGFGIVLAKPVLNHYPLIWATTLRLISGTVSLAVIATVLSRRNSIWSVFRPSSVWKWCVPGSVLGAYLSMVLWVAGFKYIDASVAGILNQTSTIFAIILAAIFLKEEFNARKVLAALLAMAGVALVALDPRLTSWLASLRHA